MTFYIEAYGADGSRLEANCSGQAVLGDVKHYRKTLAYRHIANQSPSKRPKYPEVLLWKVFDAQLLLRETVYNPHYEGN